jgi:stage II sporulation protein D
VTLSFALALFAAAAPLKVRVLERHKPFEASVEAGTLTCGDAALRSKSVQLSLKDRRLKAGDTLCDSVTAEGDVRVTLDDKVQRRFRGRLTALAEGSFIRFLDDVEVEEYLPSVVTAEAAGSPVAALEAQAVVSRTFALAARGRHKDEGYDLCDLAHCQVYPGAAALDPQSEEAVKRTRGEVLLWGGIGLKPAFFHAACGGHTSRAADVFGEDAEGVGPGVSDTGKEGPLCKDAQDFKWSFTTSRLEMARAFGVPAEGAALEPLKRDAAGRVVELRTFGRRMRGNEFSSAFGRAFGWDSLRSMKVTAEEVEGNVRFVGSGLGHGVGLCQQGARAMALKGASRKQILQKYFPDCQARVMP